MLIVIVIYGIILGFGAKLISDGAEGVLELWPNFGSVIGALLLPVLGALPDSMMIIVSGAFGPVSEAQVQLGVGVGTLAGSTIMLLTVPWSLCLFIGGCDLNEFGEAIDKKRTSWNFFRTGVTVDHDTKLNARIMLVSALAYFVVQGIAFQYASDHTKIGHDHSVEVEHPWALAGFIICTIGLVAYCIYQIFVPKLADQRQAKLKQLREERNARLRALFILQHFPAFKAHIDPNVGEEVDVARTLDFARRWKAHAVNAVATSSATAVPSSGKGNIQGEATPLLPSGETVPLLNNASEGEAANEDDDDDDDEADVDAPEEDPREHFWKNFLIAAALMLGGTAVVAVFSDPMVDAISTLGDLWGIPVFYISFILTPFCSNASELVASLAFSAKKKVANTSMTYSQLYGACVMNNTMGLGIFFALVAFRGLAWTFTAETIAILFVIVAVGIPAAFRTNFPLWFVFLNAPLYVLALVLVWLIEHYVGWA